MKIKLNFYKRLLRELRLPTSPLLMKFIKFFDSNKKINKNNILNALCDFELIGYTFNFAEYIVQLNKHIEDNNIQKFNIILIPTFPDTTKFRSQYYPKEKIARNMIDNEEINWRIYNIILPLIDCSYNKPEKIIVLRSRSSLDNYLNDNTFPKNYSKLSPKTNNIYELYKNTFSLQNIGLKSNKIGKEFIDNWGNTYNLNFSKTITINIRDQEFDPKRNSNINEWLKFANYLKKLSYNVIILPDTNKLWSLDIVFKDFIIAKDISTSIHLRIALYEKAFLNFFVPNGVSLLSILNYKSNYIFFKAGFIKGSVVHTKDQWIVEGDFCFSNEKQKLVYNEDRFENIKKAFREYINNS